MADINASSGHADDIQAAVDLAENGDRVLIPSGTHDFVEVDEAWIQVTIPAGVSVFGASNTRDENGHNTTWNTVLRIPWECEGDWATPTYWFKFIGDSNEDENTRLSDIKLQGYRSIDSESISMSKIRWDDCVDFRIDHCYFEHVCQGVEIWGNIASGVIDHCTFINLYGFDVLANYTEGNIGYGVSMHRAYYTYDPIEATMDVLGTYTDHTIFIEDCVFTRWRHCVSSAHGAHYVFRYNIIEDDHGHYSLDVHGMRDDPTTNRWGGRCAEIYENILRNAIPEDFDAVFQNGGGCGVWFNNSIDTSYISGGIVLYEEDAVDSDIWHLKDFYLWSQLGDWESSWDGFYGDWGEARNVKADWSRDAGSLGEGGYPNVDPAWSIDGYTPYEYPHPLQGDDENGSGKMEKTKLAHKSWKRKSKFF